MLGVSLASAAAARAQTDDADALERRAEADDASGAYARALAEYEEAVRLRPSAAFVPKAQARARALRAHAEGDFAPLAKLDAIRHDPARANDPTVLESLAREADAFPPGFVRGEARMLVAEAYVGRLHRPDDAIPLLERVAGDPSGDPLTARLALDMLVDTQIAAGRLDLAEDAVARHAAIAEPSLTGRVRTLVRRRTIHRAAIALVATTAVFAILAVARARAASVARAVRGSARLAIGFAAYVALGGAVLATRYESGTSVPFLVFGATVPLTVLLARAWGAAGSARAWARVARAATCFATVVAVAFLVLEWVDAEYLRGFGL